MAILNHPLGINLTNHDPIIDSPYSEGQATGYVVPPPPSFYIITETGNFIQTETGGNLLVVE